jgi:hypothetical protein
VAIGTVYAADVFARTETGGLGTADTGGAWTVSLGSAFSVSSGRAHVLMSATNRRAWLLSATAQDSCEFRATVASSDLPGTRNDNVHPEFIIRAKDNATWYSCRVRVLTDGSMQIRAVRQGGGTASLLGGAWVSMASAWTQGADYHFVGQAVQTDAGTTTLYGKCWKAGDTEPSSWQVDGVTDTTSGHQGTGTPGIGGNNGASYTSGNYSWSYDDLEWGTIASGGGSPTYPTQTRFTTGYAEVFVYDGTTLQAALDSWAAGDVIVCAQNTAFTGTFTATNRTGGALHRVLLADHTTTFQRTGVASAGQAILLTNVDRPFLCGPVEPFAEFGDAEPTATPPGPLVTNAKWGVYFVGCLEPKIEGWKFDALGQEAVKFHKGSSNWSARHCAFSNLGQSSAEFAEAIYVGSARSAWADPDVIESTNDGLVEHNYFGASLPSQCVDFKEGCRRIKIRFNKFATTGTPTVTDALLILGEDAEIYWNYGTVAHSYFSRVARAYTNVDVPGLNSGLGLQIGGNVVQVAASGVGFKFQNAAEIVSTASVFDDNEVTGSGATATDYTGSIVAAYTDHGSPVTDIASLPTETGVAEGTYVERLKATTDGGDSYSNVEWIYIAESEPGISATSTAAIVRGGVAAAVVLVSALSSAPIPRGGSASAAVSVAATSTAAIPRGGSASGIVLVSGTSTASIPRGGTATLVVGSAPAELVSTAAIPRDGAATAGVTVQASSTQAIPRAGTATAAAIISAASSQPIPRAGTASGTVLVVGTSTGAIPRAGEATIAVGTPPAVMVSTAPIPRDGSASAGVTVAAVSLSAIPRAGSATAVIGPAPAVLTSTTAIPRTGSAAATVSVTAVSSAAIPRAGFAEIFVGFPPAEYQSTAGIPRTGTASATVTVTATSTAPIPRAGTAALTVAAPIPASARLTAKVAVYAALDARPAVFAALDAEPHVTPETVS